MGYQISIDESLVQRQFIPSKQACFVIKCWVPAEVMNCFNAQFQVYTGR